jgi:hypothetical protein
MKHPPPIITLMTDFGLRDAFVGTMKGVMLGIAPHAQLVDLTHLVPPQDIRQAAYLLMTATPFFPPHTVHMVVVDPGVGSERRAIAVETPRARYVAPDNGVLTYALALEGEWRAVELTEPAYRLSQVSTTFHGRDVFSPAAAHLAAGVPLEKFGPALKEIVQLPPPRLEIHAHHLAGEVLSVDHFGNLRTSLLTFHWQGGRLHFEPLFAVAEKKTLTLDPHKARVMIGSLTLLGIQRTFSDVPPGEPLAYIGSEGGLEIAVNQGDAARQWGIRVGEQVTLLFA